jgi:hypothetical protein
MKKSLTITMLLGTLLLLGHSTAARAEEVARVTVPFPFIVNGTTLPSGKYEIRRDDQVPGLVMIDGLTNTKVHAIVSTIPDYGRDPKGDKPALTFVRDGNEYRLSQVWESRNYGRDVLGR